MSAKWEWMQEQDLKGYFVFTGAGETWRQIAMCELEADAALISAAPDLYECCVKVAEWIEQQGYTLSKELAAALKKAKP